MLKSRVSDGDRTRDNRNHNPVRKKEFRALAVISRAHGIVESRSESHEAVPGPGTAVAS